MYQYVCIGLIDFMLKGKSLLKYTHLLSLNNPENNDKTMMKHFQ